MAKSQEKQKALLLRRSGMSIKSIAEKLSVSKSSASVWCRDIVLSHQQERRLKKNMLSAGHKGRMIGAEMNRSKRLAAIDSANVRASKIIHHISSRDLLFLGIGLYWGEGSKNTENRFMLVNSDSHIIIATLTWLEKVLGVKKQSCTPQIYINDQHRYRIDKVSTYWSRTLSIPKSQFRKPVYIHTSHKKIYANHNTYMGVLHLYVQKSSTMKYLTMGMITAIKKLV